MAKIKVKSDKKVYKVEINKKFNREVERAIYQELVFNNIPVGYNNEGGYLTDPAL